jgi:hypothetical protein
MSSPVSRGFRDTLRIYVVWHPNFEAGDTFARAIHRHFDSLGMVREGIRLAVPVRMRTRGEDGGIGKSPKPIDFGLAEQNTVLLLVESNLAKASQSHWKPWFDMIARDAKHSPNIQIIKIIVGSTRRFKHFAGQHSENFYAYGYTKSPATAHLDRLLIRLSHDIAKRFWQMRQPGERISVFLSHARGGDEVGGGELMARELDDFLSRREYGLQGFLDVRDLHNGVDFTNSLEEITRSGVFLAIYSERYGTRPFCRKELLWAKRYRCPIMIALRLDTGEERSFPYKGNAPLRVIRKPTPRRSFFSFGARKAGPGSAIAGDTIRRLVKDLISETLRCVIWRRTAERSCVLLGIEHPILLPRPVELSDIAHILLDPPANPGNIIVYPDPPIDESELELVSAVAKGFLIRTLTQLEAGI